MLKIPSNGAIVNYQQREEFKQSAYQLSREGDTPEIRAEGFIMLMEAHFHRNPDAPDFTTYARHWLAASVGEMDDSVFVLLQERFPPPDTRMIADGYSDWGSFGNPNYR